MGTPAASDFDAIVAGLGAMGSAAAWQLASRGVRVLGLERFTIPNTRGSHHGHSRVIRQLYFEHPDYVPLLLRAYELWRELESKSGESLLTITGGLYAGLPGSEMMVGLRESAARHKLPHQVLSAAGIRTRFPQFRLPEDVIAVLEDAAGVLFPEKCVVAQAKLAQRLGAELHENETVLEWSADGDGVVVRTTLATYRARCLVLCCGAWSNDILQNAGITIEPSRQVVGWAVQTGDPAYGPQQFPVWLTELEDGLHYGLPELDGRGIKLALHQAGEPVAPGTVKRSATAADHLDLEVFLARHLPEVCGRVAELSVCLYENSPDGHFMVDFHPRHSNVLLACGFSGHGFKFAPVIGEVLADLATTGHSRLPIEFLSLARFGVVS